MILRSENGFKTSVYHKPTFSGVYSNCNIVSFTKSIKLIWFLFRAFSIASDFSRLYTQVRHLKDILRKNAFPIKLVDNYIKKILNKKDFPWSRRIDYWKEKELFIAVPYLGNLSFAIRTCLHIYKNQLELRKLNSYRLIHLSYWRRVSRTTLYALSIHLIICKNFLLQAYFFQISLKLTWANSNWQYLKIVMKK